MIHGLKGDGVPPVFLPVPPRKKLGANTKIFVDMTKTFVYAPEKCEPVP
jgi:hypothetical protein